MRRIVVPVGPADWELRMLAAYQRTRDGRMVKLPRGLAKELRKTCDFYVTHAEVVALRNMRIRHYHRSQLDRQVDTADDVKVFDLKPGTIAASAARYGCPNIHVGGPRYRVVFKPYEYTTIHLNPARNSGKLTVKLPEYIKDALSAMTGQVQSAITDRRVARWQWTLHVLKPFRVRFERVRKNYLRMHLTAQYAMSAVGKELPPEYEED